MISRSVIFLLFAFFSTALCLSNNDVLVFTKTEGWRHKSIEAGVKALKKLGEENGFNVFHSENAEIFTSEKLKQFKLVIFLNTTGNILNNKQQEIFEEYIKNGGSFMGIHAAADTEYSWPWYGKLVGAYFLSYPNNPNVKLAEIVKTNITHISCSHLPQKWIRKDEWYNYKTINPDINVLLRLDETTYEGGENGEIHPIAWYHEFDGGKSFYTGGGHTKESYQELDFIKHLLGGIFYCLDKN